MRDWVYQRIATYGPITAVVGDRVFSAGAVGLNRPAETTPFIVIRAGVDNKFHRDSRVTRQNYTVYAHIDPGSALELDGLLALVRDALTGGLPQSLDGRIVIDCEWESDSEDLFDDGFSTNARSGSYVVVARK